MQEKKIWYFLKNKGLTDQGIAGLMGNLYAESGLSPINLQQVYNTKLNMTDSEYTKAVDNNTYSNFVHDSAGYGIAQWTYYTRKQNLLDYAKEKNKSIGDLDLQLNFLFKELTENYQSTLKLLKTTVSLEEASNEVLLNFENPLDKSSSMKQTRINFSKKYFDSFSKKQNNGGNKMKYNSSNLPLKCIMTNSTCYKGTREMDVKGVLWHSTGANNPYLKRYVQPSENDPNYDELIELLGKNNNRNDWNHISVQAGLNCWIGKLADGSITTIQTMPWDYRPWGCASGPNGSCNNGWIQFEICEDGLTNKDYFEKVYKEACEITAYLCDMFDLDPNGYVDYNGKKIPVILCHADSYKLGCGSNHGDVYHWFSKYGKTMDHVRTDVTNLMNKITTTVPNNNSNKLPEEKKELYRIRKTWNDAESQKGAFQDLNNAKTSADNNPGYFVFNEQGEVVYPEINEKKLSVGDEVSLLPGSKYTSGIQIPEWVIKSKLYIREIRSDETAVFSTQKTGAITGVTKISNFSSYVKKPDQEFEIGNEVSLLNGSKYTSGIQVPNWVIKSKLYIREIRPNGDIVISTKKTGAITGVVNKKYLLSNSKEFVPYKIIVNTAVLNVRNIPSTSASSKIVSQLRRGTVHTILEIKGEWGRIGSGWINLAYTKRI